MIDKFLFMRLLRSQIAILLALSSVLWLVQTLDLFDDLLGTPVALIDFVTLSFLVWPRILAYTLAPALLINVLALLVRLLQDHEYFALTAAGLSPLRILRPMLALVALVIVFQGAISFYLAPLASKELRYRSSEFKNAVVVASLQAGSFREILPNMTAYADAKNGDGSWAQVMIHDHTKRDTQTTYVAQTGRFDVRGDGAYLVLSNGNMYTQTNGQADHLAEFGEYALSLDDTGANAPSQAPSFNRNHMMIHQLLNPTAHGVDVPSQILRMKARGLELIANLANPLVFMLISFSIITAGGLSRQGYGRRIFIAILLALAYQIGVISFAGQAARMNFSSLILVWPIGVLLGLVTLVNLQNDRDFLRRLIGKVSP
ncbi:LptF/LptG family permease [Alphaproteobacteria bacterium]|nr:LptF/LptG family permease [Alphaproteobacteria bacterium]